LFLAAEYSIASRKMKPYSIMKSWTLHACCAITCLYRVKYYQIIGKAVKNFFSQESTHNMPRAQFPCVQ
jgi:hypothetical protein